jgi:hypothetical protein
MSNTLNYYISSHYDTDGNINFNSCPGIEFEIWKDHAEINSDDWKGDEFTLNDFEDYIGELHKAEQERISFVFEHRYIPRDNDGY